MAHRELDSRLCLYRKLQLRYSTPAEAGAGLGGGEPHLWLPGKSLDSAGNLGWGSGKAWYDQNVCLGGNWGILEEVGERIDTFT